MPSLTRHLFLTVGAVALGVLVLSTACTRRGGNGMPPVTTPTPIAIYYVDPVKGSDTNPGTQTAPFKTITHALKVVKTAGLTIQLNPGVYSTSSGETFPIVVSSPGVVLSGSGYGQSIRKGVFINGSGEDTTLEKQLKAPPHSYYATLVVQQGVQATLDQLYVGTRTPVTTGTFAAVDALGSITANQNTFGAFVRGSGAGGVVVPGGSLSCTGCSIGGPAFAIAAFSIASASSPPNISLSGPGNSVLDGADGFRTDGTATIMASSQTFQTTGHAYTDVLGASASPSPSPTPRADSATASPSASPSPSPTSSGSSSSSQACTVDFGYGGKGSQGGNTFRNAVVEIEVTKSGASICALGNNTWNVAQGTNSFGRYAVARTFHAGTAGKNVTILSSAGGSAVFVGPAPAPTPTPSPTPSGSPSPSPSSSASPAARKR
ncbi:MAG: DUF1565 domain-containing protein [Candidatus Eremiobacteraeota bacterium]|nr:DUF1565 domain-containing protein [Candidatus Eremiobacteraeota bacterium]MBV8434107.1 DUF1565 domain-containing protein [Candidatus Eremiobacteraeota bacterium]